MKCKACKREIPDESIFCLHCGEKVVRSRERKKEISVPKPRQLASGTWFGQLEYKGRRSSVSAPTEAEWYTKARAVKLGLVEAEKKRAGTSLRTLVRNYIDSNSNTLSPATIRGYEIIYRNRFPAYMDKDALSINYQAMINAEAASVAAKTVANAWGLIRPALEAAKLPVPSVNLPAAPKKDEDFLDYTQIKTFLDAVKDQPVEPAALLALHGLRTSELLDLDVGQITKDGIRIQGATVPDKNNKFVHKDTNKNRSSRRTVPILIPRLLEILPATGKAVVLHPSTIRTHIEKVCRGAKLPVCSPHDLRRSFASLAYHLKWDELTTTRIGGWSNVQTVNKIYRKLAEKDQNADVERMKDFYAEP